MKKKNKEKKVLEPQYYTSRINTSTYNYKVYYMSVPEKIINVLIAFVIGACIGYLFYGGIGKDEYGQATTVTYCLNVIIPVIVGVIAVKLYIPVRIQSVIKKQKNQLNKQFRDMLEALSTSLGAGKNVIDSFRSVYDDMKMQYEDGAYIINELELLLSGMDNNIDIEDLLLDFGERSGNEDIESFAKVFQICYRKGGNIKDTVRSTYEILNDKMEIAEDIETVVTANKTEQNVMLIMPIGLIGMMKLMSPDFAENFVSPSGIMATTVAVIIFVAAYFIGRKVLEIKI